jgi:hypothetical protein
MRPGEQAGSSSRQAGGRASRGRRQRAAAERDGRRIDRCTVRNHDYAWATDGAFNSQRMSSCSSSASSSSRQRSMDVHLWCNLGTWAPPAVPDGERMLTCLGPVCATCMLRGVCHDPPQPSKPRTAQPTTAVSRPVSSPPLSVAGSSPPPALCPMMATGVLTLS